MSINNNSKLLLGVLGGVAVGYVLGALFAPKKGTDLREELVERLSDLSDDVNNLLEDGRERLATLAGMGGTADNFDTETPAGNYPGRQATS